MSQKFIIAHSAAEVGTQETYYGYTGVVTEGGFVVAEIQDDLAEIELSVGRVKPYQEPTPISSVSQPPVKSAKELKAEAKKLKEVETPTTPQTVEQVVTEVVVEDVKVAEPTIPSNWE